MGSSTKKKREKQKDFQKTKLKVGKAKTKPDNATSTSFSARKISVQAQSLHVSDPGAASSFLHNVSLLSSRSDTQRRDSLNYLTTSVASLRDTASFPMPVASFLPNILPLLLDGNRGIRTQLLKLMHVLPERDLADVADQIGLFVRAGLTHIAPEVRDSACEMLIWYTSLAGEQLVSSSGGWSKMLDCLMTVLSWSEATSQSAWSRPNLSSAKPVVSQLRLKGLQALQGILEAGLHGPTLGHETIATELDGPGFQAIPLTSDAFGYLNLFGRPDESSHMLEDVVDRRKDFDRLFRGRAVQGLKEVKGEGGELGRLGASILQEIDAIR